MLIIVLLIWMAQKWKVNRMLYTHIHTHTRTRTHTHTHTNTCDVICLYADLPEDFDWVEYLMEGISLVSYSASDDEVEIIRILVFMHLIVTASTYNTGMLINTCTFLFSN